MLFPDCRYSSVSPFADRVKISVGSNPWSSVAAHHNIARICERHAVAVTRWSGPSRWAPTAVDRARRIASDIVAELQG
jgi:hypothetical protein